MRTIKIENLTAGYKERPILFDVNLEVSSGNILLLIGHNGAGKSTLFNSVLGTAIVEAGEIKVDGKNVNLKNVSVLHQSENIFLRKTLRENLTFARIGKFKTQDQIVLEEILETLNLLFPILVSVFEKPVEEFSGGMRQMSAIAMVLLKQDAELYLFDEPTLGLSMEYAHQILTTIKRIVETKSIPCMIIEHEIELSLKYADQVAIMNNGKLVFHTKNTKRLSLEKLRDYYF